MSNLNSFGKAIALDDAKSMFLLMVLSIVVIGICIANAIDFRNIATQNQALATTYFSYSFANGMAIVNWIVVGMAVGVFFYSFYKIVNRGKIAREIQREIEVSEFLNAKRKTSPVIQMPKAVITINTGT
jgi:hypothetical protein